MASRTALRLIKVSGTGVPRFKLKSQLTRNFR